MRSNFWCPFLNQCYADRQEEFLLLYDADELIALETFVRHRARGEKVNVDISGPMRKHYEAGKEIFHTRIGQRDVACMHCHEMYVGQRLRGQILNQAQINIADYLDEGLRLHGYSCEE